LFLGGWGVCLSAYENQVITTRSNPSAFPSSLRQKKTSLVQQRDVEKKKVYVDEDCEKCGNKQMSVKTMQLRSADEGGELNTPVPRLRHPPPLMLTFSPLARAATVFYSCERCGHQTRLNN